MTFLLGEIKCDVLCLILTRRFLAAREDVGAKKVRQKKGNFSSKGPNWVHSRDRDYKLMGYQN